MRIVVTGATGLLGNNVVRTALESGIEVLAVARSAVGSRCFEGLSQSTILETVDADVTDWNKLSEGCRGPIDGVIHCAAQIHIGWRNRDESLRINFDGTANAIRLATHHACRFIHVSTVNALAIGSASNPADEQTAGDGQIPCTYVFSKRAAETEAKRAIESGLDGVIVYPGFMLGPWDWKPSSGRMLVELSHGSPPLAPAGGCSVCDPRDVAAGILNALTRAPSGARYVLAGTNWTYFHLWSEIAARFGVRKPWIAMRPPGRWLIGSVGDLLANVLPNEPVFNSAAVRMSAQYHWYSSQLAEKEIGYTPRSPEESLDDAIAWFRTHGYFE